MSGVRLRDWYCMMDNGGGPLLVCGMTSAVGEMSGDGFGVHMLDSFLGRLTVGNVREISIDEAYVLGNLLFGASLSLLCVYIRASS